MGSVCSRKGKNCIQESSYVPRRVYVGDVPEVTDDYQCLYPTENRKLVNPVTDKEEEPESGATTDTEVSNVHSMNFKQGPALSGGSLTRRRNSIGVSKTKSDVLPKLGRNTGFMSNSIISSRYTWYTFLPKFALEQLRRVVNTYFIFMCLLQEFTDSPISPITTATPLIFVIAVSAVKQGYEDYVRHRSDDVVNHRTLTVIRNGKPEKIKAEDVVVGDIIKIEGEEPVPADILVIGSSDDFLRCQISTANLDGETNLKIRYCPSGLLRIKSDLDTLQLNFLIECEQPSANLYEFTGSILIPYEQLFPNKPPGITPSQTSIPPPPPVAPVDNADGLEPDGIIEEHMNEAETDDRKRTRDSSPPEPYGIGSFNSLFECSPVSNFLQLPISMENIALRGTRLKNTEFIYGVVIYSGRETRLALNSKTTGAKFSTVEKSVNYFLIFFIFLLLVLVGICSFFSFYHFNTTFDPARAWYLPLPQEVTNKYIFNTVATFLILFNYVIPISLYVTLELQNFFGSKFFVWDIEMRCPSTGQPAICNTSDLNEELGQIEYLFTDKTGTLTKNLMRFRYCSINGRRYDLRDGALYLVNDEAGINEIIDPSGSPEVVHFLRTLALCHTVQLMPYRRPSFEASFSGFSLMKRKLTRKMKAASSLFTLEGTRKVFPHIPGTTGSMEFQGSSPDEKALLEACSELGVVFLGEKENIMTLSVFGKIETYRRLHTLEFDADRKCMSVIIENSNGEIYLFSKGAETTIISKSDSGPSQSTLKHIVDFAMMGMRTLAVAERKLKPADYREFSRLLRRANRTVKNREERMRESYVYLEKHLTVLGATGVEDQLQDGVPETLHSLSAAGIRVWMITGDKVETAVNVAISCGLVTSGTEQLFATGFTVAGEVVTRMMELRDKALPGENTTLIIDGTTLALALEHCRSLLQEVALGAYRVVCCRMAPLQKQEVVSLVKRSAGKPITAAVGDGANDVAMIQEAHIGVGIIGVEGRQAARCADFALARFCFLRKAILVHGHWYYVRAATLSMYFFYKNLIFILPQFLYSFDSGFSGQTLFNGLYLTSYNIICTACPIFVYGLQEQPYSAEVLLANPHLYRNLRRNNYLTWYNFCLWQILAIFHGCVIYYIPFFLWETINPRIGDWGCFGVMVFSNLIAVTHVKMFEFTRFITFWTLFAFAYSFVVLLVTSGIYTGVDFRIISESWDTGYSFGAYFQILGHIEFWLIIFLVVPASVFIDFIGRAFINGQPDMLKAWRRMKKISMLKRVQRQKVYHLSQPKHPVSILFTKRSGRLSLTIPSIYKSSLPCSTSYR